MKRSNQVMLTAVFLAAIASAKAKAQQLPVVDTNKVNDTTMNNADSVVNYNDSNAVYDGTGVVYDEPAPPHYGFFSFHWVFHWRGPRHHHQHHREMHPGGRTNGPRVATSHNGFRSSGPTRVTGNNPVAANTPRRNGFGGTMHATHSSAHS